MARRQQENDESKIRAGLPGRASATHKQKPLTRAAPRAGHCVPCFALENAQRRSELLTRLYCPPPPLEETRQDLLTQACAREPGGGRDLAKLWCLFNNNLHGTRRLCSKRRGSYYWRREKANVLVHLLCKLRVSADNYAQHKSRAAQWQFLRRAYLEVKPADLPRTQAMLDKGFEATANTYQQKLAARQSAWIADALRLLYARQGDLSWVRVQPWRTRLHLRLYRHRYAEQLLNWWRREDADWNVASCATDARDDRLLEALAERHPQLKLGTKPYVYARCMLECRGFALRGPCPGPQEGPGDYQISWQDLDDGRTRWFSQELVPWAASRLGWPTCVSDWIGFYLGPVSFGAGNKGI
eukprot:g60964.t1